MGGWDYTWSASADRLLPWCVNIQSKPRTKNGDIVLPCSSMSVASAEGSPWDTAVAILMLRQSMNDKTLCSTESKKEIIERYENFVGKGLMVAEGSLWETAIIKLLPWFRN